MAIIPGLFTNIASALYAVDVTAEAEFIFRIKFFFAKLPAVCGVASELVFFCIKVLILCVLDVVDEASSSLFLLIITLFVLFTDRVFLVNFVASVLGTLSDWLPMLLLLATVLLLEATGSELFEIFDTSDMILVLLEKAVRPSRDLYTRLRVLVL